MKFCDRCGGKDSVRTVLQIQAICDNCHYGLSKGGAVELCQRCLTELEEAISKFWKTESKCDR